MTHPVKPDDAATAETQDEPPKEMQEAAPPAPTAPDDAAARAAAAEIAEVAAQAARLGVTVDAADALRGVVKDCAGVTLYNYFTEFGLTQLEVDFLLGTATTNVQAKVRTLLRLVEEELRGETMTGVHALVSPEFFDRLIGHAKVEEAYKYYASTGAQPLREDTRRRFPFSGVVFEEYNATVTLSTGATEKLVPASEGIAFPLGTLGTLDTFVTYGAPANLIETVNTMGLPIYARQLARPDGSAIEVKTEASILPVNKRPRLAVRIFSSN